MIVPFRRLAQANVAVVTGLSVVSALMLGAVLIVVTTPAVLHVLGHIGSHPGRALGLTGASVGDAYWAMFSGAIVSPSAL
ncbi:MAG: hypothetical protein ACYCR4_02860, partial [Acidimicrobiales bacterium]